MQQFDYEKTVSFVHKAPVISSDEDLVVTVFDGNNAPKTIQLGDFRKDVVYFGRSEKSDIILSSHLVSHEHGRFFHKDGRWLIQDKSEYQREGSTNGLIYNDSAIGYRYLCDGDIIRIDDGIETVSEGVLFVFSSADSINDWKRIDIRNKNKISIGRAEDNDIVLAHVSVSKQHAVISLQNNAWYIEDCGSTNSLLVNNRTVSGRVRLHEKDVIVITNSKLIFSGAGISYCCFRKGVTVDADSIIITRGKGRKKIVTSNNVSMNIKPGELIAIIGGSGAGKSTILNCMCGYLPPAKGNVYINGINLYKNFDSIKELVGYVPQSDIVYDNLTLYDMLSYSAKLRLPKDTTAEERNAAIDRVIATVELNDKKKSYIKALSGGQRKRASIAVELLSDPNLMFLDEPASGLDPGTERNLMTSLRKMADNGKTIIMVTHSTLQLEMCDRVAFMGKGGNLCFLGSIADAKKFFEVDDIVDVYNMITEEAGKWRDKYDMSVNRKEKNYSAENKQIVKSKKSSQLPVLCSRYIKLVLNDRQRLLLLLVQAPLLAVLIALVADGDQFEQYTITKSLLFALSCSAFWVGMLNAIQEICKERTIIKREYMTGLSLTSYMASKIIVLGALCLFQSLCIIAVFTALVGLPEEGLCMNPFLEMLITTFLTALASTAMGLFVSALFTNADRAMTVAPILLMPQILFSGLAFDLNGITEKISWFAVCRWSMEGYGTTANLNDLPLDVPQQLIDIGINEVTHEAEASFDYVTTHLLSSWGILILFILVFIIAARFVIRRIGKEAD